VWCNPTFSPRPFPLPCSSTPLVQITLTGVKQRWGARHSAFAKASLGSTKVALVLLGAASAWLGYLHYTHSLGKWGTNWWVHGGRGGRVGRRGRGDC
jgi:hypothetical protein